MILLLCCISCISNAGQENPIKKTIAITIDDLPFVGEYRNFHLNMIMQTLTKQHVPATGFIIAGEVRPDNWDMLRQLKNAGLSLGNHTLTHANLGQLSAQQYQHEIKESDALLASVLTEPKYFRYPYLSMGTGSKRNDILCYLAQYHYQVAPITVDSKDFVFNQRLLSVPELKRRDYLKELKPFYLEFIWNQTERAQEHSDYHHNEAQTQILLIHANLLNAYVLPDIIQLYQEHGYQFVTLDKALKSFKDPMYCNKKQTSKVAAVIPHQKSDIDSYLAWD